MDAQAPELLARHCARVVLYLRERVVVLLSQHIIVVVSVPTAAPRCPRVFGVCGGSALP